MNRTVTQSELKSAWQPAKSFTPLVTGGLLQRKCACGQHTMSGGPCTDCDKQRRSLQRQTDISENPASLGVPPIVHDVLRSPGEPLDAATRAFFEPRLAHDFSQVPVRPQFPQRTSSLSVGRADDTLERDADRVGAEITRGSASTSAKLLTHPGVDLSHVRIHTGAVAAESARAVNALAYTVAPHIVFDAGHYDPATTAGRRLLGHELAHVLQQSHETPGRVQRAPNTKDPLDQYAEFLTSKKKIEGKADSKKKALAIIELEIQGKSGASLPDADEYLLILELAAGKPTKADLDGIIEVLERMGRSELAKVFGPRRVDLNRLTALFTGKDRDRLEDFFNRRFEGGLTQVKAGKIKSIGAHVEAGVPLASIDIIKDTITWLKTNKKAAASFFGDVWSKNKIVLLGEIHFDDVQRQFAADMLAAKGGKDVGLALEIDIAQTAEVNQYVKHGTLPKGAKGWWRNDTRFKKLIDSARATKTDVIAMDTSADERDQHMADEVIKLAQSKSKILVYVGGMHIKESDNAALGEKLATKFGGQSYAIDISHAQVPDNIYLMIKAAFPAEKSIGFDIDASPLAKHPDPAAVTKPGMGKTLDGYIYFSSTTAYK